MKSHTEMMMTVGQGRLPSKTRSERKLNTKTLTQRQSLLVLMTKYRLFIWSRYIPEEQEYQVRDKLCYRYNQSFAKVGKVWT